MGCRVLLGCLFATLLHRLGGVPRPLFANQAQHSNLPDLLRYCGFQTSQGGMAGSQIRPRSIELWPVVTHAEPDTAGGAEADQQQAGQHNR